MRSLTMLLVVVALVGPAAGTAFAADRLDALAVTLRDRPLAVDPELSWLLDARQERRILRALRGSPVPVFAAVVPQLETDESGGDPDRIATELHRRLGRPGLYVLIDERGTLETTAFDVPRGDARSYELTPYPPERERSPSFTAVRVERLVDRLASLPAGTTNQDRELRELEPYEPTFSRNFDERASFGDTAVGAGFVFGLLGLLAGGGLRMLEGRRRRREEQVVKAEAARRRQRAEKQQRRKEREQRQRARRPWWRKLR